MPPVPGCSFAGSQAHTLRSQHIDFHSYDPAARIALGLSRCEASAIREKQPAASYRLRRSGSLRIVNALGAIWRSTIE